METNLFNPVVRYLEYLRSVKRYSEHTVEAYKNDLTGLVLYLEERKISSYSTVEVKVLKNYFYSLVKETQLKKSSQSRKLASMRGFFRFLIKCGELETNPAAALRNPKFNRKLPEILQPSDFESILKRISIDENIKTERVRKLYILIFELLYGCSLRVSELCNITFGDIDISRGVIRILGKGNKERIVPIGSKALEAVQSFLLLTPKASSDYLVSLSGKRIYPVYIFRLVKKYLKGFSEIMKKSPHMLRHSSATAMLDNGAQLNAIKEILGHSSLSTTQIYTQVSIDRLKQIYKQSHPKS